MFIISTKILKNTLLHLNCQQGRDFIVREKISEIKYNIILAGPTYPAAYVARNSPWLLLGICMRDVERSASTPL